MNKKVFLIVPVILSIILIVYFQSFETEEKPGTQFFDAEYFGEGYLFYTFGNEGEHFFIDENGTKAWTSGIVALKPELQKLYDEIGVSINHQNTVVIYPIFTASAYKSLGFYDYYRGECDESCLTTKIETTFTSQASGNAIQVLALLGYEIVDDVHVDKNPEKLKNYDKVILLHNEYVTKTEFDAITSHPKVMYLYPNANYAEVEVNYESETITLIRGHGYQDVNNAFDWEFDNSPLELQGDCTKWEFYEINNGVMLNCYPDILIMKDKELLQAIKDF